MKAKYIRISTKSQNVDRQKNSDMKMYIDIISGTMPFFERPNAKQLIEDIENGIIDEVVVHAIDRLGRNTLDVINTIHFFKSKNVNITIENLGVSSLIDNKPNPVFDLITNVMATLSEMERNTLLERQKEGIEKAKAKGVYKGREKGTKESIEQLEVKYKEVIKDIRKGKYSYTELQKMHDLSRQTVAKLIKIFKVA